MDVNGSIYQIDQTSKKGYTSYRPFEEMVMFVLHMHILHKTSDRGAHPDHFLSRVPKMRKTVAPWHKMDNNQLVSTTDGSMMQHDKMICCTRHPRNLTLLSFPGSSHSFPPRYHALSALEPGQRLTGHFCHTTWQEEQHMPGKWVLDSLIVQKTSKNYGKSQFLLGKLNYKWQCS